MRIDHLVYVAEPDGLKPSAERLADRLQTPAYDGGVHPRFGTRNYIIPLAEGRFIEIVEALDHPASFTQPFGQAVRLRQAAGGGWGAWVVSVPDMVQAQKIVGHKPVPGLRHRPDGIELSWMQLGIQDVMTDPQVPYFISWNEPDLHPSLMGEDEPEITLSGITLAGDPARVTKWLGLVGTPGKDRADWEPNVQFTFVGRHGTPGLVEATFSRPGKLAQLTV